MAYKNTNELSQYSWAFAQRIDPSLEDSLNSRIDKFLEEASIRKNKTSIKVDEKIDYSVENRIKLSNWGLFSFSTLLIVLGVVLAGFPSMITLFGVVSYVLTVAFIYSFSVFRNFNVKNITSKTLIWVCVSITYFVITSISMSATFILLNVLSNVNV